MAAPIIKRPAFQHSPSQMAAAAREVLRGIWRVVLARLATLYRLYGAQFRREQLRHSLSARLLGENSFLTILVKGLK